MTSSRVPDPNAVRSSLPPGGEVRTIHVSERLARTGGLTATGVVSCPTRGWVSLDVCRSCPHCDHASTTGTPEDWLLLCCLSDDLFPPAAPAGTWDLAKTTPVSTVMGPCLRVADDVPLPTLGRVMAERAAELVVVTETSGHPRGVVSRTDLLRVAADARWQDLVASDVMTPFALTVRDTTPIAEAIELLARGFVHHLPVVGSGLPVGVVSSACLLAWLRDHLGAASVRPTR